jgi:hypothetical protein
VRRPGKRRKAGTADQRQIDFAAQHGSTIKKASQLQVGDRYRPYTSAARYGFENAPVYELVSPIGKPRKDTRGKIKWYVYAIYKDAQGNVSGTHEISTTLMLVEDSTQLQGLGASACGTIEEATAKFEQAVQEAMRLEASGAWGASRKAREKIKNAHNEMYWCARREGYADVAHWHQAQLQQLDAPELSGLGRAELSDCKKVTHSEFYNVRDVDPLHHGYSGLPIMRYFHVDILCDGVVRGTWEGWEKEWLVQWPRIQRRSGKWVTHQAIPVSQRVTRRPRRQQAQRQRPTHTPEPERRIFRAEGAEVGPFYTKLKGVGDAQIISLTKVQKDFVQVELVERFNDEPDIAEQVVRMGQYLYETGKLLVENPEVVIGMLTDVENLLDDAVVYGKTQDWFQLSKRQAQAMLRTAFAIEKKIQSGTTLGAMPYASIQVVHDNGTYTLLWGTEVMITGTKEQVYDYTTYELDLDPAQVPGLPQLQENH